MVVLAKTRDRRVVSAEWRNGGIALRRQRGGHALTRAFWYAAAAAFRRTCPPLTMRFARIRDAISTRVVATRQALCQGLPRFHSGCEKAE
jgi:hypothetical protein